MKKALSVLLIYSLPVFVFAQKKAAPHSATKTTAVSGQCGDNAEGLHLSLSGKDYDEEAVTNVNGRCEFKNVPAGDLVITKTGDDKEAITCRFLLTCDGRGKTCSKTGTFSELNKGVSFHMSKPGTVTFGLR